MRVGQFAAVPQLTHCKLTGTTSVSQPVSLESKQQRTLAWLRASVVMATLLPLALFFGLGVFRYQQICQERQNDSSRLAHIVAEHALKLFDTNKVTLNRMIELVDGQTDVALRANEQAFHRKLSAMTAGLPQVQSTWITAMLRHMVGHLPVSATAADVTGSLNTGYTEGDTSRVRQR